MRTIEISITKTTQTSQYEPVVVCVRETIRTEAEGEELAAERKQMYRDVTTQVRAYTENEIAKYGAKR